MATSQIPKIYAGMLKRELQDVAERLGLRGVKKLRKDELIQQIQASLKRPKSRAPEPVEAEEPAGGGGRPDAPPASPQKKSAAQKAREKIGELTAQAAARATGTFDRSSKRKAAVEARPEAVPGPRAEASQSPRPEPSGAMSDQSRVTAAKYRVGTPFPAEELRQVDTHLPGLPEGYGEDRLVLLPRDPHWLYAYWDLRNETKDTARSKGGKNLSLRLFELRGGELEPMAEHWCQELSRSWYIQVPSPGQTYMAEIGYRAVDGSWLRLLGSNAVKVPPAAPSAVVADQFVTLRPDQPLPRPPHRDEASGPVGDVEWPSISPRPDKAEKPRADRTAASPGRAGIKHEQAFRASGGERSEAVSGSVGAAPSSVSSPHSARSWPGSGGLAGRAQQDELGFWLVADAELVVFGATEADARVRVGRQTVRVRSDGTFSARMAFPDGEITIPIEATSADGTERRELTMRFRRITTNGGSSE